MKPAIRPCGAAALFGLALGLVLSAGAPRSAAATPKEIEQAIQKGAKYLKGVYQRGVQVGDNLEHGVGPAALGGLALLETGSPADDPAVKQITAGVRQYAYVAYQTYHVSLCLMYLNRLYELTNDPADIPLIQTLGVRLVAGQRASGGWGYECVSGVTQADAQRLFNAFRANPLPAPKDGKIPRLHPEVENYARAVGAGGGGGGAAVGDDNSNTQFAIIAVWIARKHGVPVEEALNATVRRFLTTQDQTGGWAYSPGLAGSSSPSMICAGLIGLSPGIARREERRAPAAKKEPPPGKEPGKGDKSDDPFFNPPPKGAGDAKKGGEAKRPLDAMDIAAQRGLFALGNYLTAYTRGDRNRHGSGHGHGDFYFLWSLERVGVIYGLEKIGGIDWYEAGVATLMRGQSPEGAWQDGGYAAEVNTAFAMLFLTKSNVVRDLSSKVQGQTNELRSTPGGGAAPAGVADAGPNPKPGGGGGLPEVPPGPPDPKLPVPVADEAARMAAELVKASGGQWERVLDKLRDGKGADFTRALVLAIHRLDGEKKKEAREALAERLTRMTADTLRAMMKGDDAELRRGAALAAAMKDDKAHVPDLIDRLTDDEEAVVRAAKAGLKSLTGQDHGPAKPGDKEDCKAAAAAWRAWWARQK